MINYNKAVNILSKSKIKIKNEIILSQNSINRVAAKTVYSKTSYPSGDNTAFDGYAINSQETKNLTDKKTRKFKILKTLAAGDNPKIKKIFVMVLSR